MALKLDFTGLNNIALKEAQRDFKTALEATEEPTRGKPCQPIENAYKEYQSNIRKSGSLRTDILKGVQAGEPAQKLLLKAVECISRMTGDTLFYSQIEKDLKAIYGDAFLEEIPLEWELEEVETRLEKLKEALARETTEPDAKDRIKRAIRKHEEKQTEIKELLEKSRTGKLQRAI